MDVSEPGVSVVTIITKKAGHEVDSSERNGNR